MLIFTPIQKKEFISRLTANKCAFISGGFTRENMNNPDYIYKIDCFLSSLEAKDLEPCKAVPHAKGIKRILPNGDNSYLDFAPFANYYSSGDFLVYEKNTHRRP